VLQQLDVALFLLARFGSRLGNYFNPVRAKGEYVITIHIFGKYLLTESFL
jgi:hypothetical protein